MHHPTLLIVVALLCAFLSPSANATRFEVSSVPLLEDGSGVGVGAAAGLYESGVSFPASQIGGPPGTEIWRIGSESEPFFVPDVTIAFGGRFETEVVDGSGAPLSTLTFNRNTTTGDITGFLFLKLSQFQGNVFLASDMFLLTLTSGRGAPCAGDPALVGEAAIAGSFAIVGQTCASTFAGIEGFDTSVGVRLEGELVVPEPSSALLVAIGLSGFAARQRRARTRTRLAS